MAQQHPNQANSFQPPTYDESFNNNDLAKIFVGGLSWETSDQVLRDYFSTYGVVNDVVIMRDRITGRSRGFGFVTFEDEQSADAAVLEQHVIEGRKVEAKKAIPKGEMPNKSKKVFVGGIPLNTTDVQFKKYFEQFGVVTDCQIMKERQTGRPRVLVLLHLSRTNLLRTYFKHNMRSMANLLRLNKPNQKSLYHLHLILTWEDSSLQGLMAQVV